MLLKRFSASYLHQCESPSMEFQSLDANNVRVDFPKFGAGPNNTSFLQASFDWHDAEALIRAFAEMKHPEAKRLERAATLASAVEEFMKFSDLDPSASPARPPPDTAS